MEYLHCTLSCFLVRGAVGEEVFQNPTRSAMSCLESRLMGILNFTFSPFIS